MASNMEDSAAATSMECPENIVQREIQRSFKCVICKNFNIEKMSFLLPCLHHVCVDEVGQLLSRRESSGSTKGACRICRWEFDMSQLVPVKVKDQHDKLKLSEVNLTLTACTLCTREPKLPTVKFCSTCYEFLCSPCMDSHCYMKHTSDHKLLSVEEGEVIMRDKAKLVNKKLGKCAQHQTELSLFCATCDSLVCTDCCMPPEHDGHDIQETAVLIKELRDMLREGLTEFKSYPHLLMETAIQLSDKSKNILEVQKKRLIFQLRNQLNEAMVALLAREQEIRDDIVTKTLMKKMEMNMKLRIATSVKGQFEQYLHSIPQYLEFSDADLFTKRKLLTKQYCRLQSQTSKYKSQEQRNLFAEIGWFFHVAVEENFAVTQQAFMRKLGIITYTDGNDAQVELGSLVGPSVTPQSRGLLQDILLGNRKNKLPDLSVEIVAHNDAAGTSQSVSADSVTRIQNGGSSADLELRDMDVGISLDETQLVATIMNEMETNEADAELYLEDDQPIDTPDLCNGKSKTAKKVRSVRRSAAVSSPLIDQAEELPTMDTTKTSSLDTTSESIPGSSKRTTRIDAADKRSPAPGTRVKRTSRGRTPKNLDNYSLSVSSKETTTDEDGPGSSSRTRSLPKRGKRTEPKTGTSRDEMRRRCRTSLGSGDERNTASEQSDYEDNTPKSTSPAVKQRKKPGPAPGFKKRKKSEEPNFLTELLAFPLVLTKMRIVEDNGDPNEDYCSVCFDGGGDIVCCDYCPKVFHLDCHMPNIMDLPGEDTEWQCFSCLKKEDLDKLPEDLLRQIVFPVANGIPNKDYIHACKFFVELFKCDGSEFVGIKFAYHFNRINKYEPEDINSIRIRLTEKNPEKPFVSIDEFLLAIRKMVYQANAFYDTIEVEGIQETWNRFKKGYTDVLALYYPSAISEYVPESTDKSIKHYE